MGNELKQKAVKGIFWSSIERFSAQGIQFVIGVVLARLLTPEDYGLMGMLIIFLAISQTFIDSGFSSALIQRKNRDELDYSTTFYFNIVVGLLFYLILFFTAPFIADFYDKSELIKLTRVIGLTVVINSFSVVQRAKLTIQVDFKSQTKASLTSVVISGIVGLTLAYSGFGVWALVVQSLTQRFIEVVLLWVISKWYPHRGFSYDRFKTLFSYGYKLLLSALLDTIFKNIYTVVIGKSFNANSLGYFTRARQFASFPSSNITNILQRVTFPLLSEVQDDDDRLKELLKQIVVLSAMVVFPMMMGLAALAKPFILLLLTDKWSDAIWMLQIVCFSLMWYPIHAINLNVINVKGRSDLFLRLEIIKKLIIAMVLVFTIPMGIKAMLLGQVLTSYMALVINTYYTKRIIGYGFLDQMKDLFPILFLSFVMGLVVYLMNNLFSSLIIQLVVGTISGAILYILCIYLFDIGDTKQFKTILKRKRL